MNLFKHAESNPILKDRISTILRFTGFCGILYNVLNNEFNYLVCSVIIGAFTIDLVWIKYILPKRPNAAIVSKKEFIGDMVFSFLVLGVYLLQMFIPEIIPEWKNIALGCVLFAGLAYFALSTPTPRGTW